MGDNISEMLKKVRQIEIRTNRQVSDALAGAYHSVFKGRGMDFEEAREYQFGDEIRSIDWNVTARTGKAHVKKYREERELTMMIVVDLSASGGFGSGRESKREIAAEIAATLAFSASRNGDKVGLVLFTKEAEHIIPPRKGRRHILRIIRDVLAFSPQYKGTDIMLRALERVVGEYPEKAEMIKVESVPFEKYQNLMNSSDVILDQLYSYTPAMNALVAIAKGLVVVGGGEEENYEILGEKELRPIINVLPNEESVYNELKNLVTHSERIPELSRQSVEYIHKYHDADKVAQQYVDFWLQRIDAKIKAKNDPALQLD